MSNIEDLRPGVHSPHAKYHFFVASHAMELMTSALCGGHSPNDQDLPQTCVDRAIELYRLTENLGAPPR